MKTKPFLNPALFLSCGVAAWFGLAPEARAVTFLIDFGDTATTTSGGNTWNNVTSAIGTSVNSGIADLRTTTNATSGIGLTITSRFGGANGTGSLSALGIYPTSATGDSLYGNTELFSGRENIFPAFRLTGLVVGQTYDFTFFAARRDSGDNRETEYTITGTSESSYLLNAADNTANTVTASGILPNSSGEILIEIGPGDANTNANHFTYLSVLEINTVPEPATAALFALGGLGVLRRRRE